VTAILDTYGWGSKKSSKKGKKEEVGLRTRKIKKISPRTHQRKERATEKKTNKKEIEGLEPDEQYLKRWLEKRAAIT